MGLEIIGLALTAVAAIFAVLGWRNARPKFAVHAEIVRAEQTGLTLEKNQLNSENQHGPYGVLISFDLELIARNHLHRIEKAEYVEIDEHGAEVERCSLWQAQQRSKHFNEPNILQRDDTWRRRISREYSVRPHIARVIIETDRTTKTARLDLGTAFDQVDLPQFPQFDD